MYNDEKILKALAGINYDDLMQDGYKYVVDILQEIREDCKETIRSRANKSAGRGKQETLVKAITRKQTGCLQYLYTADDGKQYACDGHRAVRLNNRIEYNPIPADVKYVDIEKIYAPYDFAPEFTLDYDINDMLIAYKVAKAEKHSKERLIVTIGGHVYNADYIADFVKVSRIVSMRREKDVKFPVLYMENECGDVYLVLPINADDFQQDGVYNMDTGMYYG